LCAERTYPSMAAAVKDIAGTGLVGYEEDTLGASALMDLRHAGVSLADGGGVMRDWREEKAHYDIPYFVICAMASRYAIDGAAAFAHTAICSGVEVSEKDVDRVYLSRLKEFAVENKLPVTLELYFTNNHAGSRTIYPSRPGNYKLSKGINSLKIDAGVFAFDDGLFHACSDIARTVTTSDAAEEVFDAMERVMLEETIPGILPGMTGEQIHSMGVNQMGAKESVFRKHGYMPDSFSWRTGYPRDIGHVLERQESNTFGFKPGVTRPVHAGMVGCVEFHCAYDGHAMTCEDSFVIDEGGAIVISRGPQEFGSDGKVIRRRQSIR
ncbi:MAG: M24 family metallopeptidase, partial [Firmicutes bacterium]|nr:M24 family metallopeptidase [Bacillota bacterium]